MQLHLNFRGLRWLVNTLRHEYQTGIFMNEEYEGVKCYHVPWTSFDIRFTFLFSIVLYLAVIPTSHYRSIVTYFTGQ